MFISGIVLHLFVLYFDFILHTRATKKKHYLSTAVKLKYF